MDHKNKIIIHYFILITYLLFGVSSLFIGLYDINNCTNINKPISVNTYLIIIGALSILLSSYFIIVYTLLLKNIIKYIPKILLIIVTVTQVFFFIFIISMGINLFKQNLDCLLKKSLNEIYATILWSFVVVFVSIYQSVHDYYYLMNYDRRNLIIFSDYPYQIIAV